MPAFLEVTVDKFTFKVAADRFYTHEGVWVLPSPLTPLPVGEVNRVRIGLSDFFSAAQRRHRVCGNQAGRHGPEGGR